MILTPVQFGAIGDGIADDTTSLQNAVNTLAKGDTLDLIGKVYRTSSPITITNKTDFLILGYGSIIKTIDSTPVTANKQLLYISDCTRFRIEGVVIDGNRSTRIPAEVAAHNVQFRRCRDFILTQVSSINSVVDGFYFGAANNTDPTTYCSDFKLINCYADNCYRQGASVINAYNFEFDGGSYTNTKGTAPEAGIDVESNPGATLSNKNGVFKNILFKGNNGVGLLLSNVGAPRNFSVENCEFISNTLGGINCSSSDVVIEGCAFSDHQDTAVGGVVFMSGQPTHGTRIANCTFDNNNTIAIQTHSLTDGTIIFGNTINTNLGIGIKSRGNNNIISNNYISDCTDIGILSAGETCTIQNNYITRVNGRGIYTDGLGAKVINNTIRNVNNPLGAYMQVKGEYSYLHGNICIATNKTEMPHTRVEGLHVQELDGRAINLNRTQKI